MKIQLTPTHFAELAWSKMRLTVNGHAQATVPDAVRLMNLELAMLDAQNYEAHRLAGLVAAGSPAAAAAIREDADRRYDERWEELSVLISALGGHDGLVDIDWMGGDIVFAAGNVPVGLNKGAYDLAQESQIPMDFLNDALMGVRESIAADVQSHIMGNWPRIREKLQKLQSDRAERYAEMIDYALWKKQERQPVQDKPGVRDLVTAILGEVEATRMDEAKLLEAERAVVEVLFHARLDDVDHLRERRSTDAVTLHDKAVR